VLSDAVEGSEISADDQLAVGLQDGSRNLLGGVLGYTEGGIDGAVRVELHKVAIQVGEHLAIGLNRARDQLAGIYAHALIERTIRVKLGKTVPEPTATSRSKPAPVIELPARGLKLASREPSAFRRAKWRRLTPLNLSNPPPITILPADCAAMNCTAPFGPSPMLKLVSRVPSAFSRKTPDSPATSSLPSACTVNPYTEPLMSGAGINALSSEPSEHKRGCFHSSNGTSDGWRIEGSGQSHIFRGPSVAAHLLARCCSWKYWAERVLESGRMRAILLRGLALVSCDRLSVLVCFSDSVQTEENAIATNAVQRSGLPCDRVRVMIKVCTYSPASKRKIHLVKHEKLERLADTPPLFCRWRVVRLRHH
jgi:hypothetical protein